MTAGSPEYTVTGLTWSPSDNPFQASTTYKATVTLTSASGYEFPSKGIPAANLSADAGGTVTGDGTTSGTGAGNTLSFTVSFPATAAPASSGLAINPDHRTVPLTVTFSDPNLSVGQSVYYSTTGDPETVGSAVYAGPQWPYSFLLSSPATVYAQVYDTTTRLWRPGLSYI